MMRKCHLNTCPVGIATQVSNQLYINRDDARSTVTAGATANTTQGNSRASRESCCVRIHKGNLSIYKNICTSLNLGMYLHLSYLYLT